MRIKVNKIRCNKCGEIIESKSVHDFKFCKCGAVAVDGGKDYLRRCGNREDWEDLFVPCGGAAGLSWPFGLSNASGR